MNPYDAAHEILTEVDTLDVSTIKAAVTAALLVADVAGDLPVPATSMSVTISKRAKRRLGQCKFRRNGIDSAEPFEINISLAAAALVTRDELADTIAHEVAHATLRFDANHGPEWMARARSYGATPTQCAEKAEGVQRSYRFAYYCPQCREVIGRQAGRPRYSRRCSTCHFKVATIDLREREVIHSTTVETTAEAETFRKKVHATIEDYTTATAAVLTLSRTA